MAIVFTGGGVGVAASGASPMTVTTATAFATTDYIVALMAYDNSGGGGADPVSSTLGLAGWTNSSSQTGLNDPGAASAGIAVRCVCWRVNSAVPSGSTVNISWTGTVTVRAITLMKVSSSYGASATVTYRTNSGATGVTTGNVNVTNPAALVTPTVNNTEGVLCWAVEENGIAITGDADTTDGTWGSIYGTNTGTGVAGVAAYMQGKVVTATATQTWNPTGNATASDWITGCLIFTETPPAPSITQAAYRFYDDAGTESGAAALAAQDTAVTGNLTNGDGYGMIRVRLQSTTAVAVPSTDDFQLQWEKNASGSWNNAIGIALADSYPASNQSNTVSVGVAAGTMSSGQSFMGNGLPLLRAGFYLQKNNSPTQNLTAVLFAHTGTFGAGGSGTGTALATSTTVTNASTLTTSLAWYYFDFAGSYTLTNGTPYVIAIWPDATASTNYVLAGSDNTSPTHAGNLTTYNGSTWNGNSAQDVIFEVYTGGGSSSAVIEYDNPNLTESAATTNRLTGGTGTFTAGKVSEIGHVTNVGWSGNNYTEILYSVKLIAALLVDGDTLRFRVLRNGATTGMTYSVTPTVNITRILPIPGSGLIAWYDADNAASFTYGTGSAVAQWNDLSGGARHLANATASTRPSRTGTLNSKSVVTYDGSDDRLNATWTSTSQPITVCVVFQSTSFGGGLYQAVVDATNISLYRDPSVSGALKFFGGDIGNEKSYAMADATPYYVTFVMDGASSKQRVNGAQVGSAINTGTGTMPVLTVGASAASNDALNGFIAEVAIWSRALTGTEITNVESYLATKWIPAAGLSAAIPTAVINVTAQAVAAAAAGTASVPVPVAGLRVTPQTVLAAGAGAASAAVPSGALRTGAVTVAGAGAGAASVAVAAAALTVGPQPVASAAVGTATVAVPTVTAQLAAQPVAAAGVGTATTTISAAALVLAGQAVAASSSGAPLSTAIPTATLQLAAQPVAGAGSGAVTAVVPTVTAQLAGQTPTTTITGTATAVVTAAAVRITAQVLTATGVGTATTAVPVALARTAGVSVVGAGAGAVSSAVVPALLRVTPQTPTAAGVGTAGTVVPTATASLAALVPAVVVTGAATVAVPTVEMRLAGVTPGAAAGSVAAVPVAVISLAGMTVAGAVGLAPLTQEGFRWRNDDGDEDGATWLAAQDTNTSVALATAARLRVLVDTAADITITPTLYYKKTTDSTWLAVPVGPGGATTLLTDDWIGTNGAAWNATKWPTQRDIGGGGGTSTIQGNQGQLAGGGRPGAFSALSVTDFELLVKVSSASALAARFVQIGWRIDPADVASSDPDGYALMITSDGGGSVVLHRLNSFTEIADVAATELNAAVTAWFRVRVVGTNHKVRWWLDGAGEPGTWQIDVTDATYAAGPLMLAAFTSTAVTFDDLTVTDPAGSPNPVYVATSANIATSGEDTTALLTAPSGKTTADFFTGRMWDDENGLDALAIFSGPWTPASLSGLSGWWDASDTASVSGTATQIAQWSDKSGSGHHLIPSDLVNNTSRLQTINGKQMVAQTAYSSPNTQLQVTGWTRSNVETIIGVIWINGDAEALTGYVPGAWGEISGGDRRVYYYYGMNWYTGWAVSYTTQPPVILQGDPGAHILATYHNGASSWIDHDGRRTTGTLADTTPVGLQIGPASWLGWGDTEPSMAYGELLIYNRALTTGELAQAYDYLSTKWGTFLDPTDITGLQAWYDAADGSTFSYSSGTVVSQWNDKSSNARNLTQATVGNQPNRNITINGNQAVAFDASGDALAFASWTQSQPVTIFLVNNWNAYPWMTPISATYGSGITVLSYAGPTAGKAYMSAAVDTNTGLAYDDGITHTWAFVFNGASSVAYRDGVASSTINPGTLGIVGGLALGGYGTTAEVLVYNKVLSTGERKFVERYLKAKWATP